MAEEGGAGRAAEGGGVKCKVNKALLIEMAERIRKVK